VEEYHSSGSNDPISVENVVGNLLMEGGSGDGSGDYSDDGGMYDSLDKAYSAWDSAIEKFKVCQPCVAHDLTNVGYNTDDDASKGSGYWTYNTRYDDDAYYDDQYRYNGDDGGGDYSDFDCYDDAGYTNVNQVRIPELELLLLFVESSAFMSLTHSLSSSLLVHEIHGQNNHECCHVP
jgi:hypothetical protein